MADSGPILKDRFEGCLLGLAVGDALGGLFEAQSADAIRAQFPTTDRLIDYLRQLAGQLLAAYHRGTAGA